jgi:hypothetical protein
MSEDIDTLLSALAIATNEEQPFAQQLDDTYEIDTQRITLMFSIEEDIFLIKSINTHDDLDLQQDVVEIIHEYADLNEIEVVVSNVNEEESGHWETMGYTKSDARNEYVREH